MNSCVFARSAGGAGGIMRPPRPERARAQLKQYALYGGKGTPFQVSRIPCPPQAVLNARPYNQKITTYFPRKALLMIIDLHMHSNVSDGKLSPADLVRLVHANGVELMALTDHDTMDGVRQASAAAEELGVGFIPGVEISTGWGGRVVHIVGLGVDPDAPGIDASVASAPSATGAAALSANDSSSSTAYAAPTRARFRLPTTRTTFPALTSHAGSCRRAS